MEEMTTEMTETQTESQETQSQETESQTVTETAAEAPSNSEPVEALPDQSDNIIHELFSELGVNLDYTPANNYQCFTMTLQFIAALWFIWWFVKYVFTLLRQSLRW